MYHWIMYPLDKAKKKHKTIEKVEMSKIPTVNPLFKQIIIDT